MVKKTSFGPRFRAWAKIRAAKNLASSITRCRCQISCTTSEKTNDPILKKKLVTDGRTDRQTDESDFIGRCPTKVKRPTIKY